MRDIRNHMLVCTNTGGQDFGNIAVGYRREAVINSTGCSGIPPVGNLTKCKYKGENSVFVVDKVASEITGLDSAKTQSGTAGKTQGVYCCCNIRTKGYKPGFPTELHTTFDQLLRKACPVIVCTHKDVKASLLKLACNCDGGINIWCSTCNCGKARRSTIDKLNTTFPQNHIIGSTKPYIADRIRTDDILAGFDNFFGKKCSHSGIECRPQIWKPQIIIH